MDVLVIEIFTYGCFTAMMEYHTSKDSSVAIRIFGLGFKLFSEDVEYVVRYLQFLLSINDDISE